MIYTLTFNPAIDKTVTVSNLTPGAVNRISSVRSDIGGKGINVSKCLQQMGCDSTVIAFFGGQTGAQAAASLEQSGICTISLPVAGEMRTNLKIIDPVQGQNTDINEPGPALNPEDLDRLTQQLDARLEPEDLLVLSGSIPGGCDPAVYRDLIRRHRSKNVTVFLDADGAALRLGVEASPDLIKPNLEELSRLSGRTLHTEEEILAAARSLLEQGVGQVLVSLGAEGAILISPSGTVRAQGLAVPVESTVGAGDSMVAAMAYAAQKGLSRAESLRLAVAISAASVMQTGTQPPEAQLVRKLYRSVHVTEET